MSSSFIVRCKMALSVVRSALEIFLHLIVVDEGDILFGVIRDAVGFAPSPCMIKWE